MDTNKTKIIIAGIGGVGGYFGGLLAKHYADNDEVEIDFLARGQHLQEIQKFGLKVIKGENEFIAKPHIATSNPAEIGNADLIIVTSKSYDLETLMQQLRPCINKDTTILPVLNGVDNRATIKKMYPDNLVLDGCVYIISRLKQAGVVENSGHVQALYFGLDNFINDKLAYFEKLFKAANIDATLSQNISTIIWEKFIFLSPTATATSYYDMPARRILLEEESLETIMGLIDEVKQVAIAKGITLSDDIIEKTHNKLASMPFEATSSMHADFKKKDSHTELASLTGYVIKEGVKHHVATPTYSRLYAYLEQQGDR